MRSAPVVGGFCVCRIFCVFSHEIDEVIIAGGKIEPFFHAQDDTAFIHAQGMLRSLMTLQSYTALEG